MGNVFVSNEPTLKDKLRDQLCRIVLEYEKLELICGYIAIFEISHSSNDNNDDDDGLNIAQNSYDTAPNIQPNIYDTPSNIHYNNNNNNNNNNNHHYNSSSTRSNLKVKGKKEIQKIIDLDYKQICEWKINEIMKNNPNMTEQELIDNHGLILYSSSNNINLFSKSNPLLKTIFKDDEKENLLQNQNETNMLNIHDAPSSTNNILDIKDILENNDIKSSVQSLGDTTDQLLQILDRAKILQLHAHNMRRNAQNNKIIHIRGNKQTIFSYYLILNRYIIISYAQSKSEYLSFMEWIKIQSKLEKLEITLKDIEALLSIEKKKS